MLYDPRTPHSNAPLLPQVLLRFFKGFKVSDSREGIRFRVEGLGLIVSGQGAVGGAGLAGASRVSCEVSLATNSLGPTFVSNRNLMAAD